MNATREQLSRKAVNSQGDDRGTTHAIHAAAASAAIDAGDHNKAILEHYAARESLENLHQSGDHFSRSPREMKRIRDGIQFHTCSVASDGKVPPTVLSVVP